MWDKKKPDTPQAAAPEPNNLLTNKESTDAMRPLDVKADRATGWLGSSLRVKGDIIGTEDLLIDGSVEGLIQLDERKLTVGKTAKLTADISARDVVVYGYVKGNVRAKGRIEIRKDRSVIGNLTTVPLRSYCATSASRPFCGLPNAPSGLSATTQNPVPFQLGSVPLASNLLLKLSRKSGQVKRRPLLAEIRCLSFQVFLSIAGQLTKANTHNPTMLTSGMNINRHHQPLCPVRPSIRHTGTTTIARTRPNITSGDPSMEFT
jgi:cytoskeletal protein CcmA (bactofilin family)